ncbi:MAG: hypothetical protein ABI806_15915 [Candidatus Solibacter sp.]
MRLIYAGILLSLASLGFADTITFKNGRVIEGTYLGGTARTIRVDDGENVRTVDVSDIQRIEFGNGGGSYSTSRNSDRPSSSSQPTLRRAEGSSSSADSDNDRPVLRRSENVMRPEAAAPAPPVMASGTLPSGTNLVIRMIDAVDSDTNRVGQTFHASLDQPVMLDGNTVIPRGADAVVKLVDQKDSGKMTGRDSLTLSLQSVTINGRMVDLNTQTVSQESGSQGAKTAKVAGGTAAVGAIIGAIAGGGKGAAIGAGAGAAAGAGSQVILGGQRVRIPSETRLTFVLDNPTNF